MDKKNLIRMSSHEAYMRYSQINMLNTKEYSKWIKDCNDNRRFAEGGENQWTDEELEALKERGGYTISMDMTRKAISSIVGMLTANKPSFKCVPVNGSASSAKVRNICIDQCYRDSDGLLRLTDIANNAFTTNIAYAFVMPLEGRIQFRKLEYNEVIVEPSSKDPMFRDAEYIYIKKWIPVEKVKAMYGLESINTAFPTDYSTATLHMDYNQMQIFDVSRRYMQIYEGYKKIPTRCKDGEIRNRIKREVLIGYEYLWTDVLPDTITEYPIIPLYSSFSSNPYKRSELHYMKDPQRFINKMYNVTIMNAQATGSPKVFVHSTDVPNEDIETFSNNYNIPGSINELNPGAEAPIIVNAQPLSQAYFTLYQDATQYLFRIYSSLGLDGGAIDSSQQNTSVSLYEKREAVMDSLRGIARIWEAFLKQLGKVILEHYSTYVSKDELIRITSANEVLKHVEEDVKNGLDFKNPQSIQQFMEKMKQQGAGEAQISEMIEEAKERSDFVDSIFDIMVDIDDLKYNLEIVQDSYAPTYDAGKFAIAMQLAQSGIVDGDTVLDYVPLDDKEKIRRRSSMIKQQSQQLEAMQQELEKTKQELEKRESQIKEMLIKGVKSEEKVKQDYLYKDARVKESFNKKAIDMDRKEKKKDLDIAIERLMMTLEANKDKLQGLTAEDVKRNIII